jgi:tRNA pseudouridine55 synthase
VRIDRFELETIIGSDGAVFAVDCGKGAYIRSLARDLAVALGTLGYVTELRRTRLGPFDEKDAISLEKLEELSHSAAAAQLVRPVETALDDIPALAMTEDEARRLRSGQSVSALKVARRTPLRNFGLGTVFCAFAEGKPVALARFEGGELRPIRVLNL